MRKKLTRTGNSLAVLLDKAMLEKVKPGAKVEFRFVQSGKDYVVTDIK